MAPLLLLSTASLYFDSLPRCFREVRAAGLDGVELSIGPASAWVGPARVHALAQAAGLQVASVHPPTVPLPGWGRSGEGIYRVAALARALPACRIVVLHTPADPRLERFRRLLAALQAALADTGIAIGLENRNRKEGEPLARYDDPAALLDLARRERCGIVLDTAHASTLPWPLLEISQAVRERLVNVHLSDVAAGGWWERFSYPRSILAHHRRPGEGGLPLAALLADLGQSGYDGLVTLELSPVALRFWNRPATQRLLQESVQTTRAWLAPLPTCTHY